MSPQAVSKWENDINYPDISLLPDLARFLGVSVDEAFLSGASFRQERVLLPKRVPPVQESAAEVVSVAADEPAEIVEEPVEQDNQGIATQSSGFSFGKLLVRA